MARFKRKYIEKPFYVVNHCGRYMIFQYLSGIFKLLGPHYKQLRGQYREKVIRKRLKEEGFWCSTCGDVWVRVVMQQDYLPKRINEKGYADSLMDGWKLEGWRIIKPDN